MATRIRLRRDTAANWTSANPVLGLGEVALEFDSLSAPTVVKAKAGDGTTAYLSLPYLADGVSGSVDWADITGKPTATVTELNFVDGVTSAIQTQLDAKALASRSIATTAPLAGGGDLSANRTLTVAAASES